MGGISILWLPFCARNGRIGENGGGCVGFSQSSLDWIVRVEGMERKKVLGNMLWRFLERCGAQGVTFVVSIVLARLLDPAAYGTLALVTAFTTILEAFVDGGFGNALIQKKDADDLDFSSVFYFNILVCLVLYAGLFVAAPVIAAFFVRPELTALVRVCGLTLMISGVKNVQQAYVARNLLFKRFFFATLGGTLTAAVVGIFLACRGWGVWALAVQHIVNLLVDTLILWFTVGWRPKWCFSFVRLKGMLKFGWKLLASSLLDRVYTELRSLVIGKRYSSGDLAYYNRGRQFPNFVVSNVNSAIDSVLFPTLSRQQEDREALGRMTAAAIRTSVFLMAPLMLGLAGCAEPLVRLLLTPKWLPCVFYLRIFCITMLFYPIHTANLNALKAMGRSDLFFKLECIKKGAGLALLLSSMGFGVKAIALSGLLQSVIAQIVNAWPNRKLLHYGYLAQLKDILPSLALAAGMAITVSALQFLNLRDYWLLCLQVAAGAVIYIGGAALLRLPGYVYLRKSLRNILTGRKTDHA